MYSLPNSYPEQFSLYCKMEVDLTLSGHAQGGHIPSKNRKGLLASSQGLFPKYTEAVYQERSSYLVVTGCLGNNGLIPRINNPGEVVVVNLKTL